MGNTNSNRNRFVNAALKGKTKQLPAKAKRLGINVDDANSVKN
jgi:hypothetical protein